MTDSYDVIVVGSGPAGVAAAVAAASRGARVALVEGDRLGGTCVNDACIPLTSMLWSATQFVGAVALGAIGAVGIDDEFRLERAVARKDRLVQKLSTGVGSLLRAHDIEVLRGRGRFVAPERLEVVEDSGVRGVAASAVVIATGSRWHVPEIAGGRVDSVVTPEVVYSGLDLPHDVIVMGGGPSMNAFAAEQAFLLAAAGGHAILAVPSATVLPGLDADLDAHVRAGLEGVGVEIVADATVAGIDGSVARVTVGSRDLEVPCDLLVVGDPRVLDHRSLGLDVVDLPVQGPIETDRAGRTARAGIFAAGDVTGECMTSAFASASGQVAGVNAAGGSAELAWGTPSRVLHTDPQIAWVGVDEATARLSLDVVTGFVDLVHTAHGIAHGGHEGLVKLVADADLGEIVGVHAVGAGAAELIAVAGAFMAMEGSLEDVAATVFWHPGPAESLAAAARDALR